MQLGLGFLVPFVYFFGLSLGSHISVCEMVSYIRVKNRDAALAVHPS